MILADVQEAVAAGARRAEACKHIGLDPRTLERWRNRKVGDDHRAGPRTSPGNKISPSERRKVLSVLNSPCYRDQSPQQIVPDLADRGTYLASESTLYRILREEGQLTHRQRSRPPRKIPRPRELVATGPNQVWSWDITYLRGPVRGEFLYLYMIEDVWSRKIIGWAVHDCESSEHAARLFSGAALTEGVSEHELSLHSDNGSPMKGATLLATLQRLGIAASFSRPSVSNDNPFSESLFRTMKFRPGFPSKPFDSLEVARTWVITFVAWYNLEHRHSAIRFVTPEQRHAGLDAEILEARREVYEAARQRRPDRWSGSTRNWTPVEIVRLNPTPKVALKEACLAS